MEAVAEQKKEAFGEPRGARHQDHDLVRELAYRLDAIYRYGECVVNAAGHPEVQKVWRDLECQELDTIRELKQMIAKRIEKGEFLEEL